jgi:hypothetical protein
MLSFYSLDLQKHKKKNNTYYQKKIAKNYTNFKTLPSLNAVGNRQTQDTEGATDKVAQKNKKLIEKEFF